MSTFAQPDIPGLPSAIHAEIAILGACMLDQAPILDSVGRLVPEDFYLDSHRRVFSAILRLLSAGMGVDLTTVRQALQQTKELEGIGGPPYLAYLIEGIPRNLNVESYVRIVKELRMRRELILEGKALIDAASAGDGEAVELSERWSQALKGIGEEAIDTQLQHVGAYLDTAASASDTVDPLAAVDGIKLGFAQFDDVTGGIPRKALVVVGAIASAGKTAFACNVVYNAAALYSHNVAFFPLEDQKKIAVRRMIAAASGVNYRSLRDGNLSPYDQRRVDEQTARLRELPIYLDDTHDITFSRLRSRCSRLKRQLEAQGKTLDLIVIDQLSHVSQADVDPKLRGDEKLGRQAHVAKLLAEEMDCAVMLMCQLTQESGKRTNPTPNLFDLAGSGQIKNFARIIVLLHRPEMWDKNDVGLAGLGQMIVAKNNEGETRTCDVGYDGPILRWFDSTAAKAKQDSFGGAQW